jgi:hypothetical protein
VEEIASLVSALESRGVSFYADTLGVRFECDDTSKLLQTDTSRIGELILERQDETLAFLASRARPTNFGAYAGIFRAAMYRICNPAGMLLWLRERCPGIYAGLDRQADRVCGLWQEGASSEEFSLAIRRLEEMHGAARGFYEACRKEEE